jgi:DNA-binding CsgD family transcriptional regulator
VNLLPGQHLIVFAPADWPEDELGPLEDGTAQPLPGPLSPREREVLSLVAAGADLQQVADELAISPATVRTHLGNAHRKLGARNRAHSVALAIQRGLIQVPAADAFGERADA